MEIEQNSITVSRRTDQTRKNKTDNVASLLVREFYGRWVMHLLPYLWQLNCIDTRLNVFNVVLILYCFNIIYERLVHLCSAASLTVTDFCSIASACRVTGVKNVEKITNFCKCLIKETLPTFAMNPSIIFAQWVIYRLSNFNTYLYVSK